MAPEWVVVQVAPDQLTAEMWVEILREEGVGARIDPSDAVSFLGTSAMSCRVLVRKERLADAAVILAGRLGSEPDEA